MRWHTSPYFLLPVFFALELVCTSAQSQALNVIKLENKAYNTGRPIASVHVPTSDITRPREVSVYVTQVVFYSLLERLATRLGYTLSAQSELDLQKQITMDLYLVPIAQAMQQIATDVGYSLVFNDAEKTVHLRP
jgi:hypothetical protein